VVDGSWVAAQRPDGSFDRSTLMAATLVQWPAWVAGTAIGALAVPSPDFVDRTGLDVVFPAFFLVLLLESLIAAPRRLVPVALAGVAVAGVGCRFLETGVALTLTACAALLALAPYARPPGRPPEPPGSGVRREGATSEEGLP
jgi:predicted branched-subunit amino acid permease